MKKNDLLKFLGITLLVFVLLSWVIPAGVFSSGKFTALESISPIGLYGILSAPVVTIASFIQFGLVFLAIGAFYGVLNKTEVYQVLVESIHKKWEKNKKKFLVITMINLILLSSIIGVSNLIFVLVPFFAAVLLKLNYSKMTTLAATVGSILIGQVGSLFGTEIWGFLKIYFEMATTDLLVVRIIFLLMVAILFILFVSKNDTKEKHEDKVIPLYEEKKTKKSPLTLVVMLSVLFVLCILGFYNWNYTFGITVFDTFYETIMASEVSGFTLVSSLLGNVSHLGYWTDVDLVIVLLVSSVLIAWVYNVKFEDTVDGVKNGAKQMLLPALYATLSFMIFTTLYNMQSGNFIATIVNKFISGSENFSLLGTFGSALVGSASYSYFPVLLNTFYGAFSLYDTAVIPVIAFLFQSIYGIVMLIAPTSVILVGGLTYLNVSYKEWTKYIWKFALTLLAIVLVVSFIVTL